MVALGLMPVPRRGTSASSHDAHKRVSERDACAQPQHSARWGIPTSSHNVDADRSVETVDKHLDAMATEQI